jgi:hypothetical protein
MNTTKQVPAPFNGMRAVYFHYHAITHEGREMLRKLREAKADAEGEPLEFIKWRSSKGKMWLYTAKSVHAKD